MPPRGTTYPDAEGNADRRTKRDRRRRRRKKGSGVLRSDRASHALEPTGTAITGYNVADVGRLLHRSRMCQGLSLRDVSWRTGIPQDQLREAETGLLVERNGLATLKTVRRYGDFLGLPGDRFALAILEDWPTRSSGARQGPGRAGATAPTPLQTGQTAAVPVCGEPTAAAPHAGETRGGARTGQLARQAGATTAGAPPGSKWRTGATAPTAAVSRIAGGTDDPDATSWSGIAFSDTGMAPAVRARDSQIVRRHRHVPAVLQ
ncbi:MAG: helix-turn-helix domain-containing protein, partial [Acidimicrobiales bacterium]